MKNCCFSIKCQRTNKKAACLSRWKALKSFLLVRQLDNLDFSLDENTILNFFIYYSEISFLPDCNDLLQCSLTTGKNKGWLKSKKGSKQQFKFPLTKREILSPNQRAMWEDNARVFTKSLMKLIKWLQPFSYLASVGSSSNQSLPWYTSWETIPTSTVSCVRLEIYPFLVCLCGESEYTIQRCNDNRSAICMGWARYFQMPE